MISPTTKSSYRPEIDGLRALAVVAVIINHFNKQILPSGYLGVDIFFVISGFVITSSLAGRPSKNFGDFLMGFYVRRIKRLVPALVLFVVITSILICLINPNPGVSLGIGWRALFGISNISLYSLSTDYFAASTQLNAFTHTWSLGVEEQFYFIFPFLAWFSGFSRATTKGSKNLFWAVGTLSVTSLLTFIYFYQTNQPAAYFLMPSRLWEMGIGCLLSLSLSLNHSKRSLNVLEKSPPSVVTAALLTVLFLPDRFAIHATVAIVLLTALLIVCLRPQTRAYNFFTLRPVIYVGLISYSLYLWHWGVLSLSRWTIGIYWWTTPFCVALIAASSIVSYRYVETPLRHLDWSPIRWMSIAYGMIALSGSAAFLILLIQYFHPFLYSGNYPYENLITSYRNNLNDKTSYNGRNCNLAPDTRSTVAIPVDRCKIGTGNQTFFFVGNSHTNHMRTTHFLLAANLNIIADGITTSACEFPYNETSKICGDIQKRQEQRILRDLKAGDIVVISNRHLIDEYGKSMSWIESPIAVSKLIEFDSEVRLRGGKVVLIAPTPEFSITVQQCTPNWYRPFLSEQCSQKQSKFREIRHDTYDVINKLPSSILVYEISDALCPNTKCQMLDSNLKPLYSDSNHLSDYANSEYIFTDFSSFIKRKNLLKHTDQ